MTHKDIHFQHFNHEELLDNCRFEHNGLIPAVVQCAQSHQVLMVAWMNKEALEKTLDTYRVHYYSRSRQTLWLKGETSGCFQELKGIALDCDGDCLLLNIEQTGAACHTGAHSCFYNRLKI